MKENKSYLPYDYHLINLINKIYSVHFTGFPTSKSEEESNVSSPGNVQKYWICKSKTRYYYNLLISSLYEQYDLHSTNYLPWCTEWLPIFLLPPFIYSMLSNLLITSLDVQYVFQSTYYLPLYTVLFTIYLLPPLMNSMIYKSTDCLSLSTVWFQVDFLSVSAFMRSILHILFLPKSYI